MSHERESGYPSEAHDHEHWFFDDLGGRGAIGPISRAEILSLIHTGTLAHSSLVWKEGMVSWVQVAQTDLVSPPREQSRQRKTKPESSVNPALIALGVLLIGVGCALLYRPLAGKFLMADDCTWLENLDETEFEARLALLPLEQRMDAAGRLLQFQTSLATGQFQRQGTFDEKRLAVCKELRAAFEPIMNN